VAGAAHGELLPEDNFRFGDHPTGTLITATCKPQWAIWTEVNSWVRTVWVAGRCPTFRRIIGVAERVADWIRRSHKTKIYLGSSRVPLVRELLPATQENLADTDEFW